tara:strand:- start:48 stop:188 length:141 start_codon:yes stop_codon:yes gene_type:complete
MAGGARLVQPLMRATISRHVNVAQPLLNEDLIKGSREKSFGGGSAE